MNKKLLRILIVARGEVEFPNTGTEVFARDLVLQMQKDGCLLDVICSGGTKSVSTNNDISFYKIPTSSRQYLSSLLFMIEAYRYFQKSLNSKHYNFLITFGVGAITPIIFLPKDKITKKIYYAIDTMVDEYCSKKRLLSISQKINYCVKIIFDIFACWTADIIFCSSKKALITIREVYRINTSKLKQFYFGLQDSIFFKKKPMHAIKPFDILLIATEHKRKGSLFFLKTLLSLRRKYRQEPACIIVGNQSVELNNFIRKHKLNVSVIDRMSNEKLYRYYSSCKILAVPSTSEGFCLPVIEAAVMSRASIVSQAGSLPEIVQDGVTGFVSSLNVNKFAYKIHNALRNSTWKKLGDSARDNAEQYRISIRSGEIISYLNSQ